MKRLKEVIIEQAIRNIIREEESVGLPIHSTWEVIEFNFERLWSEIELIEGIESEEDYDLPFEDSLEEIKKETKKYALNIFDEVLEDYIKNDG
jgi:hypothetical protein